MLYLIIYLKRDNTTIFRLRHTLETKKIGETTSMGWTILDIQYYRDGHFYSQSNYYKLLSKSIEKNARENERKSRAKKIIEVLASAFR